jgi:hypothetical protein
MKKYLFIMFLSLFSFINGTDQEAAVIPFDNLLTLKILLKYNFLQFTQNASPNDKITSNRPFDFGVGLGYKDLSLVFFAAIPYSPDSAVEKSTSFDVGFSYFNRSSMYFDAYFKYYDGFHTEKYTINGENIDLRIITVGLFGEYIFNAGHSLRGVYNLDCKQTASNGSFLAGDGLFYVSIHSKDNEMNISPTQQNIFYLGPNIGYSYIWVLKRDFFIY